LVAGGLVLAVLASRILNHRWAFKQGLKVGPRDRLKIKLGTAILG
jgi:hypothetical protein